MKKDRIAIVWSLLSIVLCLVLAGTVLAEEAKKSVAILPFSLNAPADKQYLQEGLRDILGSRMKVEAGADIVSKAVVDGALRTSGGKLLAENMPAFARKVGADYVIYGSITALGGGVSIDAQVFTAASPAGKAVQPFYASATTSDQIMQSIDSLSWDIIERLFGKKRPADMVQAKPAPAAEKTKESGVSAFTTVHPEKAFMATGGGYGLRSTRNFAKTRNFDMDLRGLALGDVDGDGHEELILASRSEVDVFHRDGTRLNKIGTVKMDARYQIHNVNTADLNGNGKAEIYISAADPKIPGSRAVEWDGKQFVDLFNEARWYIKPMKVPGAGHVLLGQGSGLTPVLPGIYELSLQDGKLTAGERLPLPDKVNLFNFAYADLDGDGQPEVVALDNSFKLQVIKGGAVVWKSEERFCGTKRYLGGQPNMPLTPGQRNAEEVDGIGDRYKETYVPSRILVSDVDHDGSDDIILNRNPDTLTTVMPRLVQYTSGTMVGLKWNGMGLEEMWRTRKIDGYVVDYQVKSLVKKLAPGETDEMFIGIILNAGTLDSLMGDQSTVVIYPFEFEKTEAK